jgi:hypothetical protein
MLYSQEEYRIKHYYGTDLLYFTDNPYIATVNQNGVITGLHIGETNITIRDTEFKRSHNIKVTVMSKYNEVSDPIIDWDAYKAEIKGRNTFPISKEDETSVSYLYGNLNNGDTHIETTYHFDSDNKLEKIRVVYNSAKQSSVIKHLSERYEFYENYDDHKYQLGNNYEYIFGDKLQRNAHSANTIGIVTIGSASSSIVYYNAKKIRKD